jgi:hypothetical protein
MLTDPIRATLLVIDVFSELNVPYLLGGSFASSIHGIPRATLDVDIVADLSDKHVIRFVNMLRQDFYIDIHMVREAIQKKETFNIIHLETMFKVDIFILKGDDFSKEEFKRRKEEVLIESPQRSVFVATPEDIILHKLTWFKAGGGVSDRQWNDVINTIKVQGERLDLEYLKTWANRLSVLDLLENALKEGG